MRLKFFLQIKSNFIWDFFSKEDSLEDFLFVGLQATLQKLKLVDTFSQWYG